MNDTILAQAILSKISGRRNIVCLENISVEYKIDLKDLKDYIKVLEEASIAKRHMTSFPGQPYKQVWTPFNRGGASLYFEIDEAKLKDYMRRTNIPIEPLIR